MKTTAFAIVAAALLHAGTAFAYKTSGNGTTYTLATLSQIEASGVERFDFDDETVYMIYENDTIAVGDKFVMDDGVTVQFDDEVSLVIEGEADFALSIGSVFESAFDGGDYASPVGIVMRNETSQTTFENCQFSYVGLRNASSKGLALKGCSFYSNNGAIGQGALTLGADGAPFTIDDCTFEYNQKAAIAGAANYHNPLTITNCTFSHNGQANQNIPQLNLTADELTIKDCTITGDTGLTMVGGIGISNYYGAESQILISGCTISDCRYGIGTVGPTNIRIEDNRLIDNHYEVNAMNGGSGISLYDPYLMTTAVIAGNRIEGNLWGVTIIGCQDVNLGQPASSAVQSPGENVFKDNGNGGQLFDLYNNSANTVYAQNNTWGVAEQTEEQIETVIFHKNDDDTLGEVIFMPAHDDNPAVGIATPVTAGGKALDDATYTLGGHRTGDGTHGIYVSHGKKVMR